MLAIGRKSSRRRFDIDVELSLECSRFIDECLSAGLLSNQFANEVRWPKYDKHSAASDCGFQLVANFAVGGLRSESGGSPTRSAGIRSGTIALLCCSCTLQPIPVNNKSTQTAHKRAQSPIL